MLSHGQGYLPAGVLYFLCDLTAAGGGPYHQNPPGCELVGIAILVWGQLHY